MLGRKRGFMLALLVGLSCASAQTADPIAGNWTLDLARTHYGPGVDRRTRETFTCEPAGKGVKCDMQSVRADGRSLRAKFTALYDGTTAPVSGMPDIDEVSLRKIDSLVCDATFRFHGNPVFAYRAFKSEDGRSLTIVSVDPESRAVLNSVVVYNKR